MLFKDLPNHHAVLIVDSEREAVGLALWDDLQSISPAHRFFNHTVLDIDTARNLISWANTPYNDEKIALISFHTATLPAQNSLLKMLEEPRNGVRFILLTSNKDNLIGTVISRVCEVKDAKKINKTNNDINKNAELFLQTPQNLRMKLPFIIDLLSHLDEEGRKDREIVHGFIMSISEQLSKSRIKSYYVLETIEIGSYASDSSASPKALIEYLALLLPKI